MSAPRKRYAILCVDDEKIVLDSLKQQLKRNFGAKYLYEFAQDANEALGVIDELADEEIRMILRPFIFHGIELSLRDL